MRVIGPRDIGQFNVVDCRRLPRHPARSRRGPNRRTYTRTHDSSRTYNAPIVQQHHRAAKSVLPSPFVRATRRPPSSARRNPSIMAYVLFVLLLAAPTALARPDPTPTLPPTQFPSGYGVSRLGPPTLIAAANNFLGRVELVGFHSSAGLCVEVDHIPQRSRAGGCDFISSSMRATVVPVAWGFTRPPGTPGITELIGRTGPQVTSVRVEYQLHGVWHHAIALSGRLTQGTDGDQQHGWFAADMRGCLEGTHVRLRALGAHHNIIGSARGMSQHAACREGLGYKVSGSITYGTLPSA